MVGTLRLFGKLSGGVDNADRADNPFYRDFCPTPPQNESKCVQLSRKKVFGVAVHLIRLRCLASERFVICILDPYIKAKRNSRAPRIE